MEIPDEIFRDIEEGSTPRQEMAHLQIQPEAGNPTVGVGFKVQDSKLMVAVIVDGELDTMLDERGWHLADCIGVLESAMSWAEDRQRLRNLQDRIRNERKHEPVS